MSKKIQVSQLLSTPNATYINGEVTGHLTNINPPFKQGAPSKAKLQDETGFINVSLWGNEVSHWEGKNVTFSGKGMQIKEYRGEKQLSVGDKVAISAAQEPDNIPGDPLPSFAAPRPAPKPIQTAPAPQTARSVAQNSPSGAPIHGATVGGALARAVDIYIAGCESNNVAWSWGEQARESVELITRDLVSIQQRVESGATEDVPF